MEFKNKIMLQDFKEVKCRWEGGKGGRVMRWEGGRFLVLFKDWEHRVSPRFNFFVSDVNHGNEGAV